MSLPVFEEAKGPGEVVESVIVVGTVYGPEVLIEVGDAGEIRAYEVQGEVLVCEFRDDIIQQEMIGLGFSSFGGRCRHEQVESFFIAQEEG